FCSASRRNDRRIVNYVTVIATQKPDKRQSKVGKLFLVGCLRARPLGIFHLRSCLEIRIVARWRYDANFQTASQAPHKK
ncbi:MAG: hypothetical protein BECKG1743D_GA0114223_109111, partial [Candidatus Kentron sp. G]